VRWALGWNGTGYPKTFVVAQHIAREYPRTKTISEDFHIGTALRADGAVFHSHEKLTELVERAALVIDASANYRVSHYLSDLARQLGKPYVWVTTTPGAYGGVVGRIRPGKTFGCWHCFQRSLASGIIKMPADSGMKLVQPGGCMQATFVGAGVDSDVVSQLASRVAIATLCEGEPEGYRDFQWDVAVGDLYENGTPSPGEWTTYTLAVHPDCPAH
jgi:molybdopterin/thiamine biosynthesis adenylyltransferase